jgi:hypothetical protein
VRRPDRVQSIARCPLRQTQRRVPGLRGEIIVRRAFIGSLYFRFSLPASAPLQRRRSADIPVRNNSPTPRNVSRPHSGSRPMLLRTGMSALRAWRRVRLRCVRSLLPPCAEAACILPPAFGYCPQNSVEEANPQGWQRVAGGRSGQRGNDHRKGARWFSTPERGARLNHLTREPRSTPGHLARNSHNQHLGSTSGTHGQAVTAQSSGTLPISSMRGRKESGTPPGCRAFCTPLPGGRRPGKPSATSGYRLATLRVGCSRMCKLHLQAGCPPLPGENPLTAG